MREKIWEKLCCGNCENNWINDRLNILTKRKLCIRIRYVYIKIYVMYLKLQKIGNSSMVTIPKKIQRQVGLSTGDLLDLKVRGDRLELQLYKKKNRNITDYLGEISIPGFDFEKSMELIKEGGYER